MRESARINFLLDLVFPKICQGCQAEGCYFCVRCQTRIRPPLARCFVCNQNSLLGQTHPNCQSKNLALDYLMVAAPYENLGIRNLIWHLKYNGVEEIAEILGLMLADYFWSREISNYFSQGLVIPVPLHRSREKLRGYNQASLIAQDFAKRAGLNLSLVLRRAKKAQSQIDLEREKRFENVKGVFALAGEALSLRGRKVILIDDVATTGATLNECAKVLIEQGEASEVWGLVVARN